MPDNYAPLFSEILDKLSKLKTKNQKIAHLRKYNSDGADVRSINFLFR